MHQEATQLAEPASGDVFADAAQFLISQGLMPGDMASPDVVDPRVGSLSALMSDNRAALSPDHPDGLVGGFGMEAERIAERGSGDLAARGNLAEDDGGLSGHRKQQMYESFVMVKLPELQEQLEAERFYHGKQWSDAELEIFRRRAQPATYFNELRKKVDSYVGIEQRMRRDPKAYPRTPKHEGDCDAATAALRQIHDATRSAMLHSEAGRDYFVRGIGVLWHGATRKRVTGRVEITKRRIPAINFFYDPRSLEWDFSDAKYLGEWGWFDVEDAEELMISLGRLDSAEMMKNLQNNVTSGAAGGIPGEWARIRGDWYSRELGRIRLCHMYYKYRGEWRCTYFCGPISLYDEVSVYEDEDQDTVHPFNPVSCNVDETGKRYGVVQDLRPIQESINARHSKLLWMMSVRQIVMEKGAVDDVNQAREQAKRPDGVIVLNPRGKEGVERRFQLQTMDGQIEGQAKLLEMAIQQMQNYGPNPAILGKGENLNQQSGRALLARQNAGMTEMSSVFERHREFKVSGYRKDWLLVRKFWTDERWFRVTDDESGFKFLAINQVVVDPMTGAPSVQNDVAKMDVDMTIEEGSDTVTMNEEIMEKLAQLGEAALGPLGKIIITLSNTPKKDYLFKLIDEATAPSPAVVEMQQRMAKLEELLAAAKVDGEIAKAEKSRADAIKVLTEAMATPQTLQEFPLRWGAPTFVEQSLQEPLNPNSMMNAFYGYEQAPIEPPPQEAPQGANSGPQGKGKPPGDVSTPPPAMPGQEPSMGQRGGLPMPGEQQSGGLAPPANARV